MIFPIIIHVKYRVILDLTVLWIIINTVFYRLAFCMGITSDELLLNKGITQSPNQKAMLSPQQTRYLWEWQATRLPLPASSLPPCTDYCPVFQRYSRWPRTIISSRRHINSTQVVLKSPSWSFNLYTVSSIHFIAAISIPLTYGSLTCVLLGPSSDVKVNF